MIAMNWDNLCWVMKAIREDLYVDVVGEEIVIDGRLSREDFEAALRKLESLQ